MARKSPPGSSFAAFQEQARRGDSLVVFRELRADTETPVSTYLKLRDPRGGSAILESVTGGERWARYSFIVPSARVRIVVRGDEAIRYEAGQKPESAGEPLNVLRAELARRKVIVPEGLPPFVGGLVGYLGYAAVRWFEPRVPQRHGGDPLFPDSEWLRADEVVAFDNLRHRLVLSTVADVPSRGKARAAYDAAQARLDALEARLQRKTPVPDAYAPPVLSEDVFPKAPFMAAVERVLEYIRAGDCMQVVLSRRLTAQYGGDPFELYRRIRIAAPAPYLFHLSFGDHGLSGASPEVMVRVEDRKLTVRPIAGTRPRGPTPELDAAMEAELRADPKELAEHVMLLDLGRNDVGRVAATGTVQVEEREVIERYSHVMHLVSQVSGKLSPGLDAWDAIGATFPAGTVSGAPKVRAMEIIDELEPCARGPYAGAVGYLSYSGAADLAIAIRTLGFSKDQLYFQAGAGLVHDSVPAREFAETEHKLAGLLRAVDLQPAKPLRRRARR